MTTPNAPANGRTPANTSQPEASVELAVVGIGASAGGFEAVIEIVRALPLDIRFALGIVLHLSPDRPTALPRLLAAGTRLTVVQAEDGMPLEAGHIYVIPPNSIMEIDGARVCLRARSASPSPHPIDSLFQSMARVLGPRATGVVLSGTGSDGALGLIAIKEAGGFALTQQPETAKFDGMPRAAIETGAVDLILSPQDIAAHLADIGNHPYVSAAPEAEPASAWLSAAQREELSALLQATSGVDFRHYKTPTINRRFMRRMALARLSEPASYLQLLREKPEEVLNLYKDLLIHVTRFFREPESFDALKARALPPLLEARRGDAPIRCWVVGCSTGEEAYSLAITIFETLGDKAESTPIQIFATDISAGAVEFARQGLYPPRITDAVSPERLRRFFTRSDPGYRIARAVRAACVFADQDVTRDPPFSRLDLILCRNVLIYMDAALQDRVLRTFAFALKPGGFLMLGRAEALGAQGGVFTVVDKHHKIFRKEQ